MSTVYSIKKGLDIKLLGEAEKTLVDLNAVKFAIKPTDFIGCFPKMLVQEGDEVKAGTPLFFDKYRENIVITSPVSGKVVSLTRGAKRLLLEIVVEANGKNESVDFGKGKVSEMTREAVIEKMLKSGVWPMVRQRPYSIIANPADKPKAIFVNAFDSAPLAPDFDLVVHGHAEDFQAGLDALAKLTEGKVHLNVHEKHTASKVFLNSKNVQINHFKGPHPSGNVSVHISRLDPLNKGEVVWYAGPQEVLTIGRLFNEGKYNSARIICLAGSEVLKPRYYKSFVGASIQNMLQNNVKSNDVRYISGNVLTGEKIDKQGYLGFYHSMVTVIPEGHYSEFLGWGMPGFNKFSFSGTFTGKLFSNKKYALDTNIHGGERAFVITGKYEQVFPFNIYPMQLLKAIMAENIDQMENLGIYEIDEEDFALCEVIDTSKTEMQAIVRKGLDFIRKEMS
jgi:Na+-transporting NADH:ubiquinone oxidoreductase subunit A